MKKIAIIGCGRWSQAFAKGLQCIGFGSHVIVIVDSETESSDRIWFDDNRIALSTDINDVAEVDTIFAPSKEDLPILALMRTIKFDHPIDLVSFLPLRVKKIREIVGDDPELNIIRAVANINVMYRNGVICATAPNGVCKQLGAMTIENEERLPYSTIIIQSITACDYKVLMLAYQKAGSQISFYAWMSKLKGILQDLDFGNPTIEPEDDKYGFSAVCNYIIAKRFVFFRASTQLQYGRNPSKEKALAPMMSCVESLLSSGKEVTVDFIHSLVELAMVDTVLPGWIDRIKTVDDLSKENLKEIFVDLWKNTPPFDSQQSIQNSAGNKLQKVVNRKPGTVWSTLYPYGIS